MRKINFTFLLTMLMSMVGSSAFAYDTCIDGIYYNFSGDEAEVTFFSEIANENEERYVGDVVIPESITYNDKNYTVTSIGNQAFNYCSQMTSVTIPSTVVSIGDYAFRDIDNLTSIVLPNNLITIGKGAFWQCRSLSSMIIPNSVVSIGEQAFGYCRGLTSITLSDNITSIGGSAFIGCNKLASVTIPNKITVLKEHVFGLCKSLTSIIIPEGITTIGICAFDYCENLEFISLPMSLVNVETCAFRGCSSMSKIVISAKIPPICGTNALLDIDKQNCKLEVPAGCINAYKSADQWKDFFDIHEGTSSIYKLNSNLSKDKSKMEIYGMNGYRQKEIKKGVNIINGTIYVIK